MSRDLSERERRFVEAYMGQAGGNGTQAAKLAGYAGKDQTLAVQARRLLKKAKVQAAITLRASDDPAVADREERQRLLTRIIRGDNGFHKAPVRDRVKAIEVLGKMQGDFVKRVQIEQVPPFRLILDADPD